MNSEVAWVLVSSGTQVQPQIILDPDYPPDYLSVVILFLQYILETAIQIFDFLLRIVRTSGEKTTKSFEGKN